MSPGPHVVRYAAAVILAAVTSVFALLTTSIAFYQLSVRQQSVQTIVAAAFAERAAFIALIDEETGVRGYVATGDAAFLEPYRSGTVAFAAYLRRSPAIAGGAGAAELDRFRRSAGGLQPYFRTQIAAVAHGNRAAALAELPGGKLAFDRVRRLDALAARTLQASLIASRDAMRVSIVRAQIATIIMAVVLIAAGTLSTAMALRARASDVLARRDQVTQLPNRRAFEERLGAALAARRPDEHLGVLYIDLDRFKPVNDRLGHIAGDKVLAACGERIRHSVLPSDFVARIGGDEFAALLFATTSDGARSVANRIAREIEAPILVAGSTVCLGASIGVAVVPRDGQDARDIVRAADDAMYQIKRRRREIVT